MQTNDPVDWMKLRSHVGLDSTDDSSSYSEAREIVKFCENFATLVENDIEAIGPNDLDDNKLRESVSYNFLKANGLYLEFPSIGEALVLLASNWIYGETLVEILTPIENKLFADSLRKMIAAQQLIAEDTGKPEKHLA